MSFGGSQLRALSAASYAKQALMAMLCRGDSFVEWESIMVTNEICVACTFFRKKETRNPWNPKQV